MAQEDWEKGGQEVTTKMVGFNKPGDFIKGTYTGKKFVISKEVNLYELKGILGSYHVNDAMGKLLEAPIMVGASEYYNVWGGKTAIDDLFNKSKFGDIVAIKFHEELPSKTKGNHPFKVFKTLQFGVDPNYMGETAIAQKLEEVGL